MNELGLGLGLEEERRKKRKQRGELHSRDQESDEGALFDAPNSKNSSFRSIVVEDIVAREDEEDEEETLHVAGAGEDSEVSNPRFPTETLWNQRIRSEIHPLIVNKQRFARTASLDLNFHNAAAAVLSPQYFAGGAAGANKRPRTPNYQKGWSSERVPLPINGRQRHLGSSGKVLPSKWEDAERWIGSPVSVDRTGTWVLPSYYRRPMSKSGPLGPHSPLIHCSNSGMAVNVAVHSPLLTGVLIADRQCYGGTRGGNRGYGGYAQANVESYVVQQSATVHEWSDLSSQGTPQDEKLDSKDCSVSVSPKVFLKEMATEMSPAESNHSSADKRSIVPPSADPVVELESHFSKLEIRDVQVTGLVTLTRRSKKPVTSERCLKSIIEWKTKTGDDKASATEVAESSKFLSKHTREEARIRAWRNLQEAKAEAAIRKLEVRLEKERSSSMDKILNKLQAAQKKAEDKRCRMRAKHDREACQTKRIKSRTSLLLRPGQLSFLSSCFTCHASK